MRTHRAVLFFPLVFHPAGEKESAMKFFRAFFLTLAAMSALPSPARAESDEAIPRPGEPAFEALIAARNSDKPASILEAEIALHKVYERHVLGKGRRESGAEWSYWLEAKNEKLLVRPIIKSVKSGGIMDLAGLKAGDVIAACGDTKFDSRGSIPRLMALLENAPDGEPLTFTVMRGGSKTFEHREKTLTVTVTPSDKLQASGKQEQEGQFDAWLESFDQVEE